MARDSRDRNGYEYRSDAGFGIGESMPGDYGDSQGTYHDRASSDNNVIVGGKATSYEDYQQGKGKPKSQKQKGKRKSKKKKGKISNLTGKTVEVTVERISGSGNAIGEYDGHHVHVEDGVPGETYKVELKEQAGYLQGRLKVHE